jgi:large subunit ribosomal protein L16
MLKKKYHKVKNVYVETNKNNCKINEGLVGLKTLSYGIITKNQIESARQCITKTTKRMSKVWIKVKNLTPKTKKSIGSRMGKGVGSHYLDIYIIKSGTFIFELLYTTFISKTIIINALINASKKFSIPLKIEQKKN